MKKNNRNPPKKQKAAWKISGKQRIIIGIAGIVLLLAGAGLFTLHLIRKNTTIIGFYDIPEEVSNSIESVIAEKSLQKTEFKVLKEKDILSARLAKKIDILVTYNGALTADLSAKAVPLSSAIRNRFPSSIKNSLFFSTIMESGSTEFYIIPVLLDHFETSYFTVLQKKSGQEYPETLSQLESYAEDCLAYIQNPLICAGAQDENLYAMISVLIESLGGYKGYIDFVNAMKTTENLDQMLSLPIGGDAPEGTTFSSVLDRIKQWQNKGLLLPEWYKTTEQTVTVSMEDNHAAVVFMSLQERRRKPFPMIKYFKGERFPPDTSKTRAIVEPAVCAMMFRSTEAGQIFMNTLSSESGQGELSIATKLGPAALRGETYDIQADDVRYFAAATPGGPVPDIGTAAYKNKTLRSAVATEIRTYLAQN